MYKIIVYFPYPLGDTKSGSAVRPIKMLEAFREYTFNNGLELIEIHGDSKERQRKIKEFKSKVNPKDILYCYMENSTLPFWLTDKDHLPRTPILEISFFHYLKKHSIPLGLFYRDIYWKFDEYSLIGYKRAIMRSIYRAEHLVYKKYVTQFFLPSNEMNKYVLFPTDRTSSLPPGGENFSGYRVPEKSKELNVIYIGGISEQYGLNDMLDAAEIVYNSNKSVKLHLICRKDEYMLYEKTFNKVKEKPWLNVYHAYGDQLKEIYKFADVAIIPRKKNVYNDFAVPVKLFEYLSYGLPIISTNCNAQAEVIEKDELGIIVKDNAESLAEGIIYFQNEKQRTHHAQKVKEALEKSHLWIHRVEEISCKLKR